MAECGVCGADEAIGTAEVEGARIAVCRRCSRFGGKLELFQAYAPQFRQFAPRQKTPKAEYELVEDYAARIAKAREAKGWTRKELEAKVAMHENDINSFEQNRVKPLEAQARKLEYALDVKLLSPKVAEDSTRPAAALPAAAVGEPTLADYLKKKY